ncbi:S-DNA-T family DNA segregation ATPase FtsK/SpoIIIE [Agromyces cerinus]|uniref:FtsK/SpoIIIE domain-containing protein n=1 Tax=Agromyces cerinus TaxID=33878 RepID=UPI00195BAF30|nr:FtsK/SpoIIIE domain-containing protein [Agromyces cerinus]MBM7832067.1 S-DNA-T family DNA segregation ATPase FtsK/SpoIIIE [Agromyces cerinus]
MMAIDLRGEVRWWGIAIADTWQQHKALSIVFLIVSVTLSWLDGIAIALWTIVALWLGVHLLRRYRNRMTLADHERQRRSRVYVQWLSSVWPELMLRLGCAAHVTDGPRTVPAFTSYSWSAGVLWMSVTLPLGMTREQLESRADAIAQNLGARRVSVSAAPGGATVMVAFSDPLEQVFALPLATSVDLGAIPLGLREDGSPWTMRLGPHTLVAGSSGSGKASLVWGLILGLASSIRSGLVQVHGIDLKSAMELGMGRELLTRFGHTPEQAVQLLEEAVASMQARALELSGSTRQHVATIASPHIVVLIDEMAALTAYQADRELMRRANNAIALLCSQGRAVGYTVFACLQDPRKETLPARGLFTQTIGLRLRDAMETAMVLGEGMRDKGALCHRIPPTMPGTGYIVPDDGSDPVRVRAGTVTDEMIRSAARDFAAPHQIPIVTPEPAVAEPASASRSRRTRRTPKGEEG